MPVLTARCDNIMTTEHCQHKLTFFSFRNFFLLETFSAVFENFCLDPSKTINSRNINNVERSAPMWESKTEKSEVAVLASDTG